MQRTGDNSEDTGKEFQDSIQPAASRQAEETMRAPSVIAQELETAFVCAKSDRDILWLIRELRVAIEAAEVGRPIDSQ